MSGSQGEEVVWAVDWGEVAAEAIPQATVSTPAPPAQKPAPAPTPPPVPVKDPVETPAPPPPAPKPPAPAPEPPAPPPPPEQRQLVRGQRARLADLGLGTNLEIVVRLGLPTGRIVDVTCLGLDADGRLSDDRYFVFYNQKATPCEGVQIVPPPAGAAAAFRLQLDRLPASIHRLVVAAAFDGPGQMRDLGPSAALWQTAGKVHAEFGFTGGDFAAEKALMLLEVYRKDGGWRTAALGQGFANGLSALLTHFGAQVI